jgi:hypothetical protein
MVTLVSIRTAELGLEQLRTSTYILCKYCIEVTISV